MSSVFINTANLENHQEENQANHLFKPIAINPRNLRKSESEITSNSTIPLSNTSNESNAPPLVYPQFPIPCISDFNTTTIKEIPMQENKKAGYDIKMKPCCSCTKTKCIKKYCECFANKRFCQNCLCIDCKNKPFYLGYSNDKNNTNNVEKERIVCTCSKSNCNKKYCDCYKAGVKCNIKCRCINCSNCEENADKGISNINLEEEKEEKEEKNKEKEEDKNNENGPINNILSIQKITVHINKNQTYINVENFGKEYMSLLNKKRNKL